MSIAPFRPQNFGRYLLTNRIAVGGMAEIFTAKLFGAMGFEKSLVIKRILPQYASDAEFLRMFITEAKLVCHLEHPNIVQVHELGEIDGQYYIAMEWVNGIDARQMWRTLAKRKQRLPGVLALFVAAEFLKGLDYAHRAIGAGGQLLGVVHRDVSPSNILLAYRGDVKIGDFGIALVQQESKTQAGVLKGKYGYMSPEQVAGLNVDHRSDIFAAGIVLTELLLGRRLFLGRTDFQTLDKVMNVRLDVLSKHESALPEEVVRIAKNALQRDVGQRYQSAREFHDDIVEFLYQRGERITSETLAAFIAQHVAPFLAPLTANAEQASASARSPISSASPPRRPVVLRKIVPEDEQLASAGEIELRDLSDLVVDDNVDSLLEDPADESLLNNDQPGSAPESSHVIFTREDHSTDFARATDANARDEVDEVLVSFEQPRGFLDEDPLTTDTPQYAAEQPEGERSKHRTPTRGPTMAPLTAAPPSAPAGPIEPSVTHPAVGEATVPLWDNILDTDYPFGAIPQLELGSDAASGSELELESFTDGPNDFASDSEGHIGQELDLSGSPAEEIETRERNAAPSILVARLPRAESSEKKDKPLFSGSLANRTVTKVLFRFGMVGESGLITLTGPRRPDSPTSTATWLNELKAKITNSQSDAVDQYTCEIALANGVPQLTAADRSEEAVIVYLIDQELLDRRGVETALRQHPHRGLIAALVAGGLLNPLQISRQVTALVLQSVLEAFSWREGQFAFYRGRGCTGEAFPTELTATQLIHKATNTLPSQLLDDYFTPIAGSRVSPNRKPPARIDAFPPDPALVDLYRALGAGRNVAETLKKSAHLGSPDRIRQALYMLLECEMAELI